MSTPPPTTAAKIQRAKVGYNKHKWESRQDALTVFASTRTTPKIPPDRGVNMYIISQYGLPPTLVTF